MLLSYEAAFFGNFTFAMNLCKKDKKVFEKFNLIGVDLVVNPFRSLIIKNKNPFYQIVFFLKYQTKVYLINLHVR